MSFLYEYISYIYMRVHMHLCCFPEAFLSEYLELVASSPHLLLLLLLWYYHSNLSLLYLFSITVYTFVIVLHKCRPVLQQHPDEWIKNSWNVEWRNVIATMMRYSDVVLPFLYTRGWNSVFSIFVFQSTIPYV